MAEAGPRSERQRSSDIEDNRPLLATARCFVAEVVPVGGALGQEGWLGLDGPP